MKVIDLLVDIANNGVSKETKHFKYFHRINEEYDIARINLSSIIYKLNNEIIDLNDEIEILDEDYIEDTPKEDLINHLVKDCGCVIEDKKMEKLKLKTKFVKSPSNSSVFDEMIYYYDNKELGNKINEIIDKVNGE